jgi:hypothetical protein
VIEEEFEDNEMLPQLMDDLLSDLRELAGIAEEITVTRNNGETVRIKYKREDKDVGNVAVDTAKESKFVLSADGRSFEREATWGGEQ